MQYLFLSAGSTYVPAVNEHEEKQRVFNHKQRFPKCCTHFLSGQNATQKPTVPLSVQTIDLTRVCSCSNERKQTAVSEKL